MMPQKKNPDPLELVRGKTGRAIGHLMALLTTMKGLPSGYNKDLQEDKQAVFDAEDTLAGCLAVVPSIVVDGLDAQSRAGRGARHPACSWPLTLRTIWSARGVPFRRAHEIVGALVRKLVAEGRDFESLALDEWRAASDLFDADIVDRVTPARVGRRQADAAVDAARRRALGLGRGGALAGRGRAARTTGWPLLPLETSSAKIAAPFANFPSSVKRRQRTFRSAVSSWEQLMQQRQLRLGDILDDYCPRERRLTNHAVVAMVGDDVKQTRCTTCDAEHEYKHAKVPRQRRKSDRRPRSTRRFCGRRARSASRTRRLSRRQRRFRRRADAAAAADARSSIRPRPGEPTVAGATAAESSHDPGGRRWTARTMTSGTRARRARSTGR